MPQRPQQRVPVFVDESGSRRRTARGVGYATGAAACAYALMLAVNLAFQPVAPPDNSDGQDLADATGQKQPGVASPPMPGASYEPAPDREVPGPVVAAVLPPVHGATPPPVVAAAPLPAAAAPPKTTATRQVNLGIRPAPRASRPKPVAHAGPARHKGEDNERHSES